jgi:Polyketide cyclase / dehydrase and lipid transport
MAKPIQVQQSRSCPVRIEQAFAVVLPAPLPGLFARYALLPPITQVCDQVGDWGTVGQSRTIVLSDGGTRRERLVSVTPPSEFSYRIDGFTGLNKALFAAVDGRWAFAPDGDGTRITWSWTIHPTSSLTALALPVVGLMWNGYARQALSRIATLFGS